MQSLTNLKTGVKFNEFGLGIEHFVRNRDHKFLRRILDEAYDLGITHFDIVYNYPHFYKIFKEFLDETRDKITFNTHIGQVYDERNDKSKKSRSMKPIVANVEYIFKKLNIETIDTGIIQYITNINDFKVVKDNKILEYVYKLKELGKLRSVGISSHNQKLLLEIIRNHEFDVIMFPVNFITGHFQITKELIDECKTHNIKIMSIKTLLHGKAFSTKKVTYPKLMSCFQEHTVKLNRPALPYQCFNHAFKKGVDQVIFGVENVGQLRENLQSYKNNMKVQDYEDIERKFIEGDSKFKIS